MPLFVGGNHPSNETKSSPMKRSYYNNSGSLSDPDQPEIITAEQQEARDEAESRAVEAAIDSNRGDEQ